MNIEELESVVDAMAEECGDQIDALYDTVTLNKDTYNGFICRLREVVRLAKNEQDKSAPVGDMAAMRKTLDGMMNSAEAIRLVNDILEREKYRRALTIKKRDDPDLNIIIEECEEVISLLSKCGKNVNSESAIYTDDNGNSAALREVLDGMMYEAFFLCDSGIPPVIERGKLLARWCDKLRAAMMPNQFTSPTAGRAGSAETAEAKGSTSTGNPED